MCVSLWVLGKTWIRSVGGCQGEKNHINHYARLHCLYSHGWCGGQTKNVARTTKDAMTGGNIHWHWMSWNHQWMSTPNKWLITQTLFILLRIHGDTLKATRLKKLNIHKKNHARLPLTCSPELETWLDTMKRIGSCWRSIMVKYCTCVVSLAVIV